LPILSYYSPTYGSLKYYSLTDLLRKPVKRDRRDAQDMHNKIRLNPQKLLLSKWTAAAPRAKEKHFIVTRLICEEEQDPPLEFIEIEAIHSKRRLQIGWRELQDSSVWLQGWV